MSLACVLRLPLEKIRLTNITITDARGMITIIDATQFLLSSNGTVGCFKLERNAYNTTVSRTGLRRLQATSQAQVDYYIVEPPTEILALTPAEFSSVMESSSAMTELSASVGSTGVVAVTESSLAASSAAPTSTASTPNNAALIGGVVGGVALAVAVVAGVVGFGQMRKRAARSTNLTRSSTVNVVHTSNPIGTGAIISQRSPSKSYMMWGSECGQMAFAVTKTRSSV